MELRGYYILNNETYNIVMTEGTTDEDGSVVEIMLGKNNMMISSYMKSSKRGEFCYLTKQAKQIYEELAKGMAGCTSKNGYATIFKLGTASKHEFKKGDKQYCVMQFNKKLCGAEIDLPKEKIYVEYYGNSNKTDWNIPYVKIGTQKKSIESYAEDDKDNAMDIPVRSVDEIALEKDITWLKGKKYYVVNDEETADKIFKVIEQWKGPVAYDVETSGLKMNMFGKIGSDRKKQLDEYNKTHTGNEINVDYLVGLILCIEKDVSYYFPCANRKFKNLYNNTNDKITSGICNNILSEYTIGKYRDRVDDMANYIRKTPKEEWGCDVILMERIRYILENCSLVAHNGIFEWKSSWIYNIDINLKDDTMVLHKMLYKFRTTTDNRGEPSDLKHLSKVELGIDQLELSDFFVGYTEDSKGTVRTKEGAKKKKKDKVKIDFSYMDYEGSKAYAPADGDCTLQIYLKYKSDLLKNNSELEYLYNVEILVSCAVAYAEFYGHRLDETKIEETRQNNLIEMALYEHKFRALNNLCTENENELYKALSDNTEYIKTNKKAMTKEEIASSRSVSLSLVEKLNKEMTEHGDFNIGAPGQVAKILYGKYDFKLDDDGKMTVNKKFLKQYLDLKDENGELKYPEVSIYTEWKKLSTLNSKFFEALQDFMYPGGYVFSHYGSIATATGRMSCNGPNAQQYPKAITGIVIPREDYVHVDADFSQIEYRTLVAMAHETELIESFQDPDSDYHTTMASLMFDVPYALVTPKMRSDSKSFNFGIPYGMGFKSLAILLTGRSGNTEVEEAKEKYELYFKAQPNVRRFFNEVKEAALVNQYTTTYFGRKRFYSFVDKEGNYSSKKRGMALRQAGNAVIQGSAADIFKIAVARNFVFIRQQQLLGKLIMINFIHDEILFEVNCKELDARKCVADIITNMQFSIKGFPPLYVGAGVGADWKDAKGKMAEIHPLLGQQYVKEAQECQDKITGEPADVIKYFDNRVYEFRKWKINTYLLNETNRGKVLSPVIGNILGLQFDYGAEDDYKKMAKEQGMTKEETAELMKTLPLERLKRYIKEQGLSEEVDINWFTGAAQQIEDVVVEEEYTDDEDENIEEPIEVLGGDFALIDEDATLYGVDLNTLIRQFSLIISKELKVCGIDITVLPYRVKDEMINYIYEHQCDESDEDAMQVVFLRENNLLLNTGVYVKGIEASELTTKLKIRDTIYR